MGAVLAFNKTRDPGGWMSNMAPHPVVYCGKHCRTTEHLFQALRLSATLEGPLVERVLSIPSPLAAKWAAKAILRDGYGIVEPWSEADVANMRICVNEKRTQNPEVAAKLAATDQAYLIEDTTTRVRPDQFWGAARLGQCGTEGPDTFAPGDGSVWVGRNWLGQIWMDERSAGRLL